jgi:hypothetical protein
MPFVGAVGAYTAIESAPALELWLDGSSCVASQQQLKQQLMRQLLPTQLQFSLAAPAAT